MPTDIKITFTNQAHLKAENNCVVVFAAPTQVSDGPSALAWQVIKDSDSYCFDYPARTWVQATWDGGRSGTARKAVETSSFALEGTESGFALVERQPGASPNQFSVVNEVEIASGVTVTAFKAGNLIMSQAHLTKGQRVEFLLLPKLCWAVMPSTVAVGDIIDLEAVDYQEVNLQGREALSVTLKGSVDEGYQFRFSELTQQQPYIEQVSLDPKLTIACAHASLAAYSDYKKPRRRQVVPGYRCVGRFTGWDKVSNGTGRKERFGLILQSVLNPSTYLIAFRGTDSYEDAYEDLWIDPVPFEPYGRQNTFPQDVLVADGFNSIYSLKGGNMKRSMQAQLFKKLSRLTPAPEEIITTGHSLGGPLAALFTLDVAHSFGNKIRLKNITFASPRVGLQTWKETYNNTYNLEPSTYRIANYYDLIPSLPPKLFNYHHIGQQFLISFFVKDFWYPHYVARHSLVNYLTVISKAVQLEPQIYIGDFYDATAQHRIMKSTSPPSVDVPSWADIIYEAEQTALRGLATKV